MTAQRQETQVCSLRKGWCRTIALIGLVTTLALPMAGGPGAHAATTERVVTNRYTGLAIGGVDPVAYFTDGKVIQGDDKFELAQAGVVWRFRNADNRAYFAADPDVYGPQFGGYDPVDVARGVAFAGNPQIWLISDNRLYLFGREQTRDAFAAQPAEYLGEATRRWAEIVETLAE
jgi:hypothetical protein